MVDKNEKFNLDDLIDEEDIREVKEAASRTKARMEEDAWHKEYDPNYEQWRAERNAETMRKFKESSVTLSDDELKRLHML